MPSYKSNSDKVLQAVLLNEGLMKYGNYDERDCSSIDVALTSDNFVVHAVAQIISGHLHDGTEASIYREVADYLKQTV